MWLNKQQLMNHNFIFSENMKMSDVVSSNPKLMLTLSRFGIELGFGDHSIKEVCERAKVSPLFFTLICNIYSNQDFIPTLDDLKSVDCNSLLSYLSESHKYYVNERLPHIEFHLNRIIEACPERFAKTLDRFFKEYKSEVTKHFSYEEVTVFPYIIALNNKDKNSNFTISEFKSSHTNIEDKLSDLMNILIKYLPANIFPKERIEISLDIMDLSSDLSSHTIVEERILVPFVELLEYNNYESQ